MGRLLLKVSFYLLLFFSFVSKASGQVNYVPGEIIVKMKGSTAAEDATSGKGMTSKSRSNQIRSAKAQAFLGKAQSQKGMSLKASFDDLGVYHLGVKPGQRVEDAINDVQADPDVEYAEPNYIFSKATIGGFTKTVSASDVSAMAGSGSYLATSAPIHVTDTWGTVTENSVPVVAVIDTGLDTSHDVFDTTGAIWVNTGEIASNGIDDDHNGYVDDVHGYNFVSNSGNMIDDDGHGTHVSGIILGVSQNIYTTPFAPAKIRIMPLKFLDGSGYGNTSDAIKAVYYAVNNGATVLNNSWGGPSYSAALHEAITYAYNHGVLFVAAAGNEGKNNDASSMYPANYNVPNVISVAATSDSDLLAYFSNFGVTSVDLGSPGVFILSSVPGGGYGSSSGTSMAAPFVSGVAALIKMEQPTMLSYQIKEIILGNGDYVADLANKVATNSRLNVQDVVATAKVATVDPTQPAYTYSNQDRELASTIAAGGCGLVKKLSNNMGDGSGQGPGMGTIAIVLLFTVPMVIWTILRRRADGRNRRQFDRFKVDSEVKINVGGRELVGSVSTISLGGAQINTNALLEQGGIVQMVIRSPDGKEQIQVEGHVVWCESKKAYGVQFDKASAGVQAAISQWTKGLVKT